MASSDSHDFQDSHTVKSNYPFIKDVILYFGIVVDDILDTTLLEQKAEELVRRWPILGGFLDMKTKPYSFSTGKNTDVKSRVLKNTGREALPILYNLKDHQSTSPLVFSSKSGVPDTLFHFDTPSNKGSEPILTLRITCLKDVTLLGFRCPHYFADSQAMFDIIKAYATLVSGKPIPSLVSTWDEKVDPMSKLVPDFDILSKQDSADSVPTLDGYQVGTWAILLTASHMLWKWVKRSTGFAGMPEERYVYIPSGWINDIRQRAIKELSDDEETKDVAATLTKQDIITAWFLKTSYQTSIPDDRPIDFYYSLNWRYALPPLPEDEVCIRHSVYAFRVRFDSLRKLQQESLAQTALTLRRAVTQIRTPSEVYKSLRFFEHNSTNLVTMGGDDIDLNRVPILSSSTAMPFCELNFQGASTTGSEAKVIYAQPWAPLEVWMQFTPFSISTKDGKGGYWLRMSNVPEAWKGFSTEIQV